MDRNKYIAGGLSGIVEVLITHPLDYIKIKKQEYIQNKIPINNFYKTIYNGNIWNFYTGIISRLIGIVPMRVVFWGVQGSTYDYLKLNNIQSKYNFLIIGTTGGFSQSIIDNQIELIKISKMTNTNLSIKSFIQFKGFMPTLYRNVGFANIIAFACFNFQHETKLDKFIYSSTSGLIGSILTQPLDYVKTIKQTHTNSLFANESTLSIIAKTFKENPQKLFAGVTMRCLLSYLSMGIGFIVFDSINEIIR